MGRCSLEWTAPLDLENYWFVIYFFIFIYCFNKIYFLLPKFLRWSIIIINFKLVFIFILFFNVFFITMLKTVYLWLLIWQNSMEIKKQSPMRLKFTCSILGCLSNWGYVLLTRLQKRISKYHSNFSHIHSSLSDFYSLPIFYLHLITVDVAILNHFNFLHETLFLIAIIKIINFIINTIFYYF